MYPALTPLFLLFVFVSTAYTEQRFIDKEAYPLSAYTLSKKYCSRIESQKQLCQAYTISYVDSHTGNLPSFMRGVDTHITPLLNTYRKSDPQKLVTNTIKQFGDTISGDWYDNTNITLFAKTPRTYTLSIESDGYSGGAHGYYTIAYINIDTQTQKQLSLSNLFLPKYTPGKCSIKI